MKSIYIKLIASICLVVVLSSCEDFLNQVPQTSRSAENFYKTQADFNNAIVGAYATFKNQGLYGNGGVNANLLLLTEVVSDNATHGATKAVSNLSIFEIDEFNFSLANTVISSVWTGHYVGIGRANTILDKLSVATFDEAAKSKFEGEAKFLRALFYFNLVRLFGDVQLITQSFDDPYAANDIPRSRVESIYELIIADLTFAEANLPETIASAQAGRASRWAAKAVLGKVYLTRNQYQLASAKLNEVILSNQFSLTANTYPAVFSPATSFANNKDVILAAQYKTGLVGQGSAWWSDAIPFGIPGSLFGTTGSGVGFMQPTQDMVAAYEINDLRKDASVASSYVNGSGVIIPVRYPVKFRQSVPQAGDSDIDFPIVRYADVVLMYAEALNEQDQTTAAEPFLNQVRKRANLPAKNGLSKADFKLAIENERRVELAFEGHRWFDLVRTNRYLQVMTGKNYPVQTFHRLYPVPQRERDLNSDLGQNEGYN